MAGNPKQTSAQAEPSASQLKALADVAAAGNLLDSMDAFFRTGKSKWKPKTGGGWGPRGPQRR